ncbi:hypothetical protein [Sphaerisporangium siamense]|uniref:SH3 domain-containing protein n=1 Tax=Sphaerisporangium siamense TaxID=795645 RepID=A0A7W7GBE1_9ACTN|nr:hypothetical protein [Sphaerisporangium siamense]MBB4702354.1 hypothetical protein [Sphaerisporangium siamense]
MRKIGIALCAAALVTGVSTVQANASATSSAASADDPYCGDWRHANYDDSTGTVTKAGYMKAAPYNVCDRASYVNVGTYLYYWCYAVNGYGHTWTYARVAGTSKEGWLPDGYLSNGGSFWSCNGIAGGPKLPESLMQEK